ncbi:MAG TPA: tRNA lysidine(34) synthetase TilS [Caulobacteraceae bacterium]
MRGLTAFDRHLSATSPAPLAVAFSGGGDSLALLLMTRAWADAHGRRVVALTVDHGLNPASGDWTEQCRKTAERLGVGFAALYWTGDKPKTGLPAAARAARHALLADAARAAGAHVLLMGHTADDLMEAAAMRADGSTVPDPRAWSPSPAWPQGRGLFILRPLLETRRAELREWLTTRGETWIDDPANSKFARGRARTLISAHPDESRGPGLFRGPSAVKDLGPDFRRDERWGVIRLPRSSEDRAVAAAALCAGGTTRPPRGDRLAKLMAQQPPFTATLAGARIEADGAVVTFLRDAGETGRGGLQPLRLTPHEPAVWDGRFEITADQPLLVTPLKGRAAHLPPAEQQALKAIPAAARPALPALVDNAGHVHCPVLAAAPIVRCRSLVVERFTAAVGLIGKEADLAAK